MKAGMVIVMVSESHWRGHLSADTEKEASKPPSLCRACLLCPRLRACVAIDSLQLGPGCAPLTREPFAGQQLLTKRYSGPPNS